MPEEEATMREENATVAQICAYWNALVRNQDVGGIPLEPELAATIQHLHTLNIAVPDATRDRVRDLVQRSIDHHREGVPLMTSPMFVTAPSAHTLPLPGPQWTAPRLPSMVGRSRVATLAALLVLILVLGVASLPFLASHLGQQPEDLAILSALTPPEQTIPSVQEITGGEDPLAAPAGVAVASDGTLYVIDVTNDQIRVFTADGTPKATWGTSGDGPGEFGFSFDQSSGDLAIGPDGHLYVLDQALARVQVFTPDGTYLFGFAERGSGDGQLLYPNGIGVGPDGAVYVADYQNHRVQVFAGDGTFLASWDGTKDGGVPLAGPADVAVDADGTAWVTDDILQKIIGFGPDGTVVSSFGTIGAKPGEVRGPWGIAVDAAGRLYVADYGNDRIQQFTPDGTLLGLAGSRGEGLGQLTQPRYIAVSPDGGVYVTEEDAARVQKFTQLSLPSASDATASPESSAAPG